MKTKVNINRIEYGDDYDCATDGYAEIQCHNCGYSGWTDVAFTETTIIGSCPECDIDFEDKLR